MGTLDKCSQWMKAPYLFHSIPRFSVCSTGVDRSIFGSPTGPLAISVSGLYNQMAAITPERTA